MESKRQILEEALQSKKMAAVKGNGDWQDNRTLSECMLYMLENEIMCDVTFIVGPERKFIKAHKYMLASRSPVFYTMFNGSIPEEGRIKLPDIEENTFNNILRYIYTDDINISNANLKEILYAADKYMLFKIKNRCLEILKSSAFSSDATFAFQAAHDFQLDELMKETLCYIECNTRECLSSEPALKLSKDCVKLILESDFLSCSETDVCKFFVEWTGHQCKLANQEQNGENLRNMAGSLLYLVRFPLVDMKYFSGEVAQKGLLSEKEVVSIFTSHFGESCELFPLNKRCPIIDRDTYKVLRYRYVKEGWKISGVESLVFKSDKDIWLKGLVSFGTLNKYDVIPFYTLDITDDQNRNVLSLTELFDFRWKENKITFATPLHIKAHKPYTLAIQPVSVITTYYGTACKTTCTTGGVTITFQDSSLCTTGANTEQGQIAGLLFSHYTLR